MLRGQALENISRHQMQDLAQNCATLAHGSVPGAIQGIVSKALVSHQTWNRASSFTAVGQQWFSGHLFCFRSKRGDYLKILYWDGSGLCLFAKRLERGKFVWPPIVDGGLIPTPAQLALLLEAIDWRRTVAPALPARPTAV